MDYFENKNIQAFSIIPTAPTFMHECRNLIFLTSGGVDSTALLHGAMKEWGYKADECKRMFFIYDAEHQKHESEVINFSVLHKMFYTSGLPELIVHLVDPSLYKGIKTVYYPMRNAIMITIAAAYAEKIKMETGVQYHIVTGILPDGEYPDTTVHFCNSIADMISPTGARLFCPWISLDAHKSDLVYYLRREGYKAHEDFWSCNTPLNGKPCGYCVNCKIIEEEYYGGGY